MKFSITTTQAQLLSLLQAVSGVIRNKCTVDILRNVLLKTHADGRITAVGSDLEVEIVATQAIGEFTGALDTTIEIKPLLEILQTMPDNEVVTLESDAKGNLVFKGADSKFKLVCKPSVDYPRMELAPSSTNTFEISQRVMKGLIDKASFAIPVTDLRYYLVGMQLTVDKSVLSICTTDGHRLVTDSVPVASAIPDRIEVILPRKSVLELKRLLRASDDVIVVQLASNQARIRFGSVEFVTKLVEGKFPDITRVIPLHNENKVRLNRGALLLAMQRASIITNHVSRGVKMGLSTDLASGLLTIEASNEKSETVNLTMPVDYAGPSVELAFNVNYLLDALPTMDGDELDIALGNAAGPALMTLPLDQAFKYILMPMKM